VLFLINFPALTRLSVSAGKATGRCPESRDCKQNDKDWFYRSEERCWITMNDNSSWRRIRRVVGQLRKIILHTA
jgi:hypothetical protein